MSDDPFRVLGLPARPDLTDDDIRAAWRRIAAATHPDRADGGDPARFAGAAAAYTELRPPSAARLHGPAPPLRPRRALRRPDPPAWPGHPDQASAGPGPPSPRPPDR